MPSKPVSGRSGPWARTRRRGEQVHAQQRILADDLEVAVMLSKCSAVEEGGGPVGMRSREL